MFSRSVLRVAAAIVTAMFLFNAGCATIMSGSTQVITINSTPKDASARIDGLQISTPGVINLKKGREYTIMVEKPGYETAQVKLGRSFNPTYLLNILFGPIFLGIPLVFGLVYDWGNGATEPVNRMRHFPLGDYCSISSLT